MRALATLNRRRKAVLGQRNYPPRPDFRRLFDCSDGWRPKMAEVCEVWVCNVTVTNTSKTI